MNACLHLRNNASAGSEYYLECGAGSYSYLDLDGGILVSLGSQSSDQAVRCDI